MNTNELKYLWASTENGLSPEKASHFAAAAVAQVNRERRRRRGFLVYISMMVALMSMFAIWQLIQRSIGWGEAWPATLIIAAQWMTVLHLWRIFGQSPTGLTGERSIRVTLETLLQKTSSRCRELQTLLGLFLVVVPLVSAAIYQLRENGKMRPNEAASASVFFGAILLGGGGWILYDLIARKLPEKRHLESLMREYS